MVSIFRHLSEQRVGLQVLLVPLMQFLDVSDAVDLATLLQHICVLAEESVVDDASAVVLGLEVRVRKADEYLVQLTLPYVVSQVPHGVSAQYCQVITRWVTIYVSQRPDLLAHEVDNLVADLHSQDPVVREQ